MILNIHGFMGVADNRNFQAVQGLCQGEELLSPKLDYLRQSPGEILAALSAAIQGAKGPVLLVGQSLGGWFANQLSLRFCLPCILTNPCLQPWECDLIVQSPIPSRFLQDYQKARCASPNPLARVLCSRQDEVLPNNIPRCQALTEHVRLVNGSHSDLENRGPELKALLYLWRGEQRVL